MEWPPLKFLLVYDGAYPDTRGGVERRNLNLARGLVRAGHEVTIAAWFNEPPPDEPGIHYIQLGKRKGVHDSDGHRTFSAAWRFARDVARLDVSAFDVAESANIPYGHLFPLYVRCRAQRVPLLVTWHEYWGGGWFAERSVPLAVACAVTELAAAQIGAAVIPVSGLTARRLRRARIPGKVRTIYAGVEGFAPTQPGTEGSPLLYVGRLLPHKRLPILLEAVSILADELEVAAPLLTIGGVGSELESLKRLADELGISEIVRFAGAVSEEEYRALLAQAKVAVQPSSREGFGLFALEAMAHGVPVVYCRSMESALSELVRDGVDGIATSPRATDLALAIRCLLTDDDLRDRMGTKSRARAEQFSWDRAAAQYVDLSLRLLGRHPSLRRPSLN